MTQHYTFLEMQHPFLSILLFDNFLSFIFFMYSHPLYLAYLLYFSPYLLQIFSFLFPLLISTTAIVLLLLFHYFTLEGEIARLCLFDQLSSLVVFSIGNVFEWEYETMLDLYKNPNLNFGVEENWDEVSAESSEKSGLLEFDVEDREIVNSKPKDPSSMYGSLDNGEELNLVVEKSELLESDVGAAGGRVSLRGTSFESEMAGAMSENLEHLRTIDELHEIHTSQQAELSMGNLKNSEVLVSQTGTGDQVILSGDNSFVPQTPDRMSEIPTNSPLTRRNAGGHGGGQSLPRGGSMKVTNKHSSLNYEVLQEDPTNQEFTSKLLKSQSTKGSFKSSSVRREEQECRGALGGFQRDGSMRKGKEWKRTLACKLYEERMTFKLREERDVDEGAEEMDFLWEAYEKDAIKSNNLKSKGKNGKGEVLHIGEEEDAQEDEEEEGDETTTVKICCLQALRLSTGKMNLGVGRPNLVRFVKAFKGIGFRRQSGSSTSRS